MALSQIERINIGLTDAYQKKGWRVEVRVGFRDESPADVTTLIHRPSPIDMFSHLYNFYISEDGKQIKRVVISGDYNLVIQESNAIARTNKVFGLPVKEIRIPDSHSDSIRVNIYTEDYSELLNRN